MGFETRKITRYKNLHLTHYQFLAQFFSSFTNFSQLWFTITTSISENKKTYGLKMPKKLWGRWKKILICSQLFNRVLKMLEVPYGPSEWRILYLVGGFEPLWNVSWDFEIPNNPFLLILNVPQILKTGVHLQFQKISDWPIWLLIDPL